MFPAFLDFRYENAGLLFVKYGGSIPYERIKDDMNMSIKTSYQVESFNIGDYLDMRGELTVSEKREFGMEPPSGIGHIEQKRGGFSLAL